MLVHLEHEREQKDDEDAERDELYDHPGFEQLDVITSVRRICK